MTGAAEAVWSCYHKQTAKDAPAAFDGHIPAKNRKHDVRNNPIIRLLA